MKIRPVLALAAAAIAVALASFVTAPRAADTPPAGAPDMAVMMQEMMRLATPGEAHKKLEPVIGTWDATVKFWMGGPGGPATEDKGSATFKWIMDGRYVQEDFAGTTTMPDGKGGTQKLPFKGMSLMGYDNFRNMYVSNWLDNMGTAMATMTGSAEPSGKTIHMYGQLDEPSLKVVGRTVHTVTRWVNGDQFVFEMYDLHASPDYKIMEITYTRKKA